VGDVIATNPLAGRDYHLIETFEAGLELKGAEVKSLRNRRANLRGAFARVERGQMWLYGLEIAPYEQAGPWAPESKRVRRLLMHRYEIQRLGSQVDRKGLTIVATKLYFKGPWAKVELALAKGKRVADKREAIRKREIQRDVRRALKKRMR